MENTPHIVHSHTYAPYPYTVRELDRFFVVRADPSAHQTCITASHLDSNLPGSSKIGAIMSPPSSRAMHDTETAILFDCFSP